MSKKKGDVVIAFIHPGEVSAFFMTSMLATVLAEAKQQNRIVGILQEWSSANVSQSRNNLAERFLDKYTAEWLFFIDSDMQWMPQDFNQVLESADPNTAPIVGGLCFGINDGALFPTIYHLTEYEGEPVTARVPQYPAGKLFQVSATGAAFLCIHRSVLEKMRDAKFSRAFPFFQEMEMGGRPCGEDITFCLRALGLEFPVHVDTRAKIGHHKDNVLTEEQFLAQQEAANASDDDTSNVERSDAVPGSSLLR